MKISVFALSFLFLSSVVFAGGQAEDSKAGDSMMKKEDTKAEDSMMKKEDSKAEDSMMVKDSTTKDPSAFDISGLGSNIVAYAGKEDLMKRTGMGGTTVLYFAATWCPTCQATYKDIKMNASKLPADVTLVFVNYDKEADLKKEFGVASQHTFVQLDAKSMKKNVWVGSSTVMDILKKLGR